MPSDVSFWLLLFILLIVLFAFFALPYFNIELTELSLKKKSNPVLI